MINSHHVNHCTHAITSASTVLRECRLKYHYSYLQVLLVANYSVSLLHNKY